MAKSILALVLCLALLSGCSTKRNENIQIKNELKDEKLQWNYNENPEKFFITRNVKSPSLKDNILGDPPNQPIRVFLPPSYYSSGKRYPVVYYLHGFNSSYLELDFYKSAYTNYITSSPESEYILVGINGRNRLDGCFYANSPVTGNWEDYIVKDVVAYIDNSFNTIEGPDTRGICGFSMGGMGAINIGFSHPDVFSAIFALSPGIFDNKDIERIIRTWNTKMFTAYGAAFAPETRNPYPHIETPKFNNTPDDNAILNRWLRGGGDLEEKVKMNMENIRKLKGIHIEYGNKDFFDWLPDGCRKLSKVLDEYGISHKLVEFTGSHGDKNAHIAEKSLLPYFGKLFKGK